MDIITINQMTFVIRFKSEYIMSQKRFDEYLAKTILERCFPEKFFDLQISDKPDLRYGTQIGIEVTNCMPTRVAEAFNLWHRVAKQGSQTPPRIFERLEQLDEVQLVDDELIWVQGMYSQEELLDFYNAVEKKVERLNSTKANYAPMDTYELFINSFIMIPRWKMEEALARLGHINSKTKKYSYIYLVTNEKTLLIFDMINNTLTIKHLYSYLDRLAEEAKSIYLGTEN